MVNKLIRIAFFTLLASCVTQYHIKENDNGEPIVDKQKYSFNKKMSSDVFDLIDTTSVYVEILSEKSLKQTINNFNVLIFHNDGYFESTSTKYFRKFKRSKNSVYYGGKYFVTGNKISIEEFYPAKEARTNYYVKEISEGQIKLDTIQITIFDTTHIYIKKNYNDLF